MRSLACLLAAVLCLTTGCVTRELHITTEPSEATITINRTYTGTSPMTVSFVHYQVFGILIEKDGYDPLYVEEPIKAPFYEKPGIDLITESLPIKKHDRRELHYTLKKAGESDDVNEVLGRAQEMKERLDRLAAERAEADSKRRTFSAPILPVRESARDREDAAKKKADETGDAPSAPIGIKADTVDTSDTSGTVDKAAPATTDDDADSGGE